MRHPITPEFMDSAPEYIVQLYRELEETILRDICRRFAQSGEVTETALEQIRILQRRGLDLSTIEKHIKKTVGLSNQALDELFDTVVSENRRYYDYVIEKADIVIEPVRTDALMQEIEAIRQQTKDQFYNLTQSMGFAIRANNGKVVVQSVASAYQKILDDAEVQVWSGGVSYNRAVETAVKRITSSGLQWVDYESGWHNRADVAVRRAVMTGITQISSRYADMMGEELETDLVEVDAHIGARDTGEGYENHKAWQGKVYSRRAGDKYPSVYAVCGLGEGGGLCGWNCRHGYTPFIDGISERAYTDEELNNIDPDPFEYQGKKYNAYQATQQQRKLETALRAVKRDIIGYSASGQKDLVQSSTVRMRRLMAEYERFSKAANLPTQYERARVNDAVKK